MSCRYLAFVSQARSIYLAGNSRDRKRHRSRERSNDSPERDYRHHKSNREAYDKLQGEDRYRSDVRCFQHLARKSLGDRLMAAASMYHAASTEMTLSGTVRDRSTKAVPDFWRLIVSLCRTAVIEDMAAITMTLMTATDIVGGVKFLKLSSLVIFYILQGSSQSVTRELERQ